MATVALDGQDRLITKDLSVADAVNLAWQVTDDELCSINARQSSLVAFCDGQEQADTGSRYLRSAFSKPAAGFHDSGVGFVATISSKWAPAIDQLRVFADDCFLAPSWQSVSLIKSGEIFRSYSDTGNTFFQHVRDSLDTTVFAKNI